MNNDQIGSAVWFSLGLAICLGALQYKLGTFSAPKSGFVPFLTGAAISFFAAVGFLEATLKGRGKKEGWTGPFRGGRWENFLLIVISLVVYILLLVPLGFFLCTALFMAFLFRVFMTSRWPWVIGGALVTAFGFYFVFEIWLKVQFPKGFWG